MELIRYEKARQALAEARDIDDVKKIHDVSAAMKAYAKQANDRQLEIDAGEIRIRAERRLGEMLRKQKETTGLNAGGRPVKTPTTMEGVFTPTLEEIGIDYKLSSRSQGIANIPIKQFESFLSVHREAEHPVTSKAIEQLARSTRFTSYTGEFEWYTPPQYIEAARDVMGSIDLDPASSDIANSIVKASKYYTKEDDGLSHEWHGNVWLNPPYCQPEIKQFSFAVSEKYRTGEMQQAIVLVNNATETAWFQEIMSAASAICFVKGRIKYLDKTGEPVNSPLQGQCFLYLGNNTESFDTVFRSFGPVAKLSPSLSILHPQTTTASSAAAGAMMMKEPSCQIDRVVLIQTSTGSRPTVVDCKGCL